MSKCPWALSSEIEEYYHDTQWGVPVHDDRLLFEMLILEGAQAGLSWSTVLKKRKGYRKAFAGFNVQKVANFSKQKQLELQNNPQIIRHTLKISSAVTNAQSFIDIQKQYGSFDTYIWSFVGAKTRKNTWQTMQQVPTNTHTSDTMSQHLKKAGFKFVGSTICYAYMQAVGMVNDHLMTCPSYTRLAVK